MSRRENTERLILQALEAQILETGMGGVGINAIAKRAGVSKELIYRYFDGMPGLMLAWMQEQDFWTRNPGLLAADESSQRTPGELVLSMLRAQIDALASNETLREDIRRYEQQYAADARTLYELHTDPAAVEKVARVHLFMKTDNEDVYVIEKEQ